MSKLNAVEASADVTDATNVNAAGAVMETDTSTASMDFVKDEDDLSSNSATYLATQQSIKAYVDGKSHTDTTYTGSSGVHLVGTDFRTSGVGIFNVIQFGEEAGSTTAPNSYW